MCYLIEAFLPLDDLLFFKSFGTKRVVFVSLFKWHWMQGIRKSNQIRCVWKRHIYFPVMLFLFLLLILKPLPPNPHDVHGRSNRSR